MKYLWLILKLWRRYRPALVALHTLGQLLYAAVQQGSPRGPYIDPSERDAINLAVWKAYDEAWEQWMGSAKSSPQDASQGP